MNNEDVLFKHVYATHWNRTERIKWAKINEWVILSIDWRTKKKKTRKSGKVIIVEKEEEEEREEIGEIGESGEVEEEKEKQKEKDEDEEEERQVMYWSTIEGYGIHSD